MRTSPWNVWVPAALLFLAACGGGTASGSDDEHADAVAALCEAERLATDGDTGGAGAAFQDRAHDYLHELADGVARFDRGIAGSLLEDKNGVELLLAEESPDPAALAQRLGTLITSVNEAAGALQIETSGCGEAA